MICRLLLLALLVVAATPSAVLAEVRTGAFTLTPMVGYQAFDSNLDIDDAPVYGVALGYNAARNWALELDLRYAPTDAEFSGGPDVDVWSATGNVLYHFQPEQAFVPYLVVGIGGLQYDVDGTGSDDEDFIANWGGGFKYALGQDVDLRLDLRHTIDFRTDNEGSDQDGDVSNNFAATFGLNFQFGGYTNAPVRTARQAVPATDPPALPPPPSTAPAAAAPPLPVDGDTDSVTDAADRCPGTSPGVRVDKAGCPADSDGDGVADYLDACVDTPAGVKADARGCPKAAAPRADSLPLKITFAAGRSEINPFHYRELERAAAFIRQHPQEQLLVEVPADAQGLAQARAENLRGALVSRYGIPTGQLLARGDSLGGRGVVVSVIP